MSGFIDLSQETTQGGSGIVQFLAVLARRPPPGLTGYFVLRAEFDCPSGRPRALRVTGYDRNGAAVVGEAQQIDITQFQDRQSELSGFACGQTTPQLISEVFTSPADAVASIWRATAGDGLDSPEQFHFSFLADGGDPSNPMYVYVDPQTIHRGAGGLSTAWVIYVWRRPARWANRDLVSQYVLSRMTYDCAHSRRRQEVEYGHDARSGQTLFQGGDTVFYPIQSYSSDEDELHLVCGSHGGSHAVRRVITGIDGAVADVARRSRGAH